jgi:hypothetical protein
MTEMFGNMENIVNTHYANVLTGGARAEYNTNKLNTQESLRNFQGKRILI